MTLKYKNDTDYLMSVPGMAEKIKEGINTPLSDCVHLSEAESFNDYSHDETQEKLTASYMTELLK